MIRLVTSLILALVLGVVVLNGCTRTRPGVQPEEMRILANWIEDTVHGIPRRAGELELLEASNEFQQAAQWAGGSQIGDQRRLPPQIQSRITRASALAAALRSRVVLIDRQQGLIGPAPDLSGAEFMLAAQIADAENHDRRTGDALVLSRSTASAEAALWYREAARQARVALDLAAGGNAWEPVPKPAPKPEPDQPSKQAPEPR